MPANGHPLTDRQREILRHVVEEFVARTAGRLEYLIERSGLQVSSSTVRGDLASSSSSGC